MNPQKARAESGDCGVTAIAIGASRFRRFLCLIGFHKWRRTGLTLKYQCGNCPSTLDCDDEFWIAP